MSAEIKMPQLSDTMNEGTVVTWHKKEGEKVRAGEKIADVETDKAVMEMEAYDDGTLAAILVPAGQKVAVGAALAVLATGKEDVAEVKAGASGKSSAAPAPNAPAVPIAATAVPAAKSANGGQQPSTASSSTTTLENAARGEIHEPDDVIGHKASRTPPTPVPPLKSGNGEGNGNRLRVSPLARRIAEDQKIDLHSIQGSGPGGRIVQKDVLAAAERPAIAATAQPAPAAGTAKPAASPSRLAPGEKQVIPLTKMRAVIAQRLQQSKQTIPHFYETIDVDVEELSALRGRVNAQLESQKIRLSVGDFIAKAIAVALLKHPALNAHFNGTETTRFGSVHLGMAVALPEGLIVPVLRNIDQLGLKDIRTRSAELVDKARAQKLKGEEMSGATFTVSNLGTYGVREFSAIVNPPEVAILAVGGAEPRPVVRNGQIVARTMMSLTLSADHRVVDGATAAEFLRTLKGLLEEPGMMLV